MNTEQRLKELNDIIKHEKEKIKRYKAALEEIAQGEGDYYQDDQAQIALEALRG